MGVYGFILTRGLMPDGQWTLTVSGPEARCSGKLAEKAHVNTLAYILTWQGWKNLGSFDTREEWPQVKWIVVTKIFTWVLYTFVSTTDHFLFWVCDNQDEWWIWVSIGRNNKRKWRERVGWVLIISNTIPWRIRWHPFPQRRFKTF